MRVRSCEGNQDGPHTLEGDGDDGDVASRMHPSDAAKKDAVFSHGEIDARGGQHGLAEKAKGGKGDARSDQRAATRAERSAHHGRSRRGCRGESGRAEGANINKIDGSVDGDDAENAEHEATRKSFSRIADFASEEAGGLPPAVSKEDGGHR